MHRGHSPFQHFDIAAWQAKTWSGSSSTHGLSSDPSPPKQCPRVRSLEEIFIPSETTHDEVDTLIHQQVIFTPTKCFEIQDFIINHLASCLLEVKRSRSRQKSTFYCGRTVASQHRSQNESTGASSEAEQIHIAASLSRRWNRLCRVQSSSESSQLLSWERRWEIRRKGIISELSPSSICLKSHDLDI